MKMCQEFQTLGHFLFEVLLDAVGRIAGVAPEIEVEPGTDPRDYVIGAERLNARLPEHSFTDLPEALASTVDFHRMRLK